MTYAGLKYSLRKSRHCEQMRSNLANLKAQFAILRVEQGGFLDKAKQIHPKNLLHHGVKSNPLPYPSPLERGLAFTAQIHPSPLPLGEGISVIYSKLVPHPFHLERFSFNVNSLSSPYIAGGPKSLISRRGIALLTQTNPSS